MNPSPKSPIDYIETNEQKRLNAAREEGVPWKKWGPYLSERQWGTVREDYSQDGNAWNYFTHDQSRSRAYRWGEDGLAGISGDKQQLCFAIALWNGRDPILKERLFGLTNSERNHGEDVKEYYFYLDSTPTHSYMKYLYKYPQQEFPYRDLVETNSRRTRDEFEYELLDTGVFDADRYFDVFVEYAKAEPEDLLIRITAHNRGPEKAELHLLPTLWFRNTWSWDEGAAKPVLRQVNDGTVLASHDKLGDRTLSCEGNPELLFTENESNANRLWGQPSPSPYVKDAFHHYVISGHQEAVDPSRTGTKSAAYYRDVHLVGTGHARAGCAGDAANGPGYGVRGQREVGLGKAALPEAVVDHRLGSLDHLLGRLRINDEGAGPIGFEGLHGLGQGQQPDDMGVMAAGMHDGHLGAIEQLGAGGGPG